MERLIENRIFIPLFILLFFLILFGCKKKDVFDKLTHKEFLISRNWKLDSLGCLNKRDSILRNDQLFFNVFLNKDVNYLKSILGKPNINILKKNRRLCYYLTCKFAPTLKIKGNKSIKQNLINKENKLLIFIVENDLVKEFKIIQP